MSDVYTLIDLLLFIIGDRYVAKHGVNTVAVKKEN